MSLHPTRDTGESPETAAVAHAALPRGHACLGLRDALDRIHTEAQFADLFAHDGQPAACPWRLALVRRLQFFENLSDRPAADAVRARIDWKYLLGLDSTDPGFDASVLSDFRSRLVSGGAAALLFDSRQAFGADAMAGGGTEGGLGGGRGDAVALTELHEERHLVIGHMTARHGRAPRRKGPCPSPAGRSHQTACPLGGHADADRMPPVGLRPPYIIRSAFLSPCLRRWPHPDCRAAAR